MPRPKIKDLMFSKFDPDAEVFVLDAELAIARFSPTCLYCAHSTDAFGACDAFPNGDTPLEIWNGENPHTSPYSDEYGDDQGITFSPTGFGAEGRKS
jgi:hypothetical protein